MRFILGIGALLFAMSAMPAHAERCAAIAVSTTDAKPDGWGAESYKDTCEAAVSSAVAYCEDNMRSQGIPNPHCRKVKFSTGWVVAIVCHVPGKVWRGIGTGKNPEDAINAAFAEIPDALHANCGTTVIRSGSHKWREFYTAVWTVKLNCGKGFTTASHLKGFTALTRAMLSCGHRTVSSCSVVRATYGDESEVPQK